MSTPSRLDRVKLIPGLSEAGRDTRREIYRNLGCLKLGCIAAPIAVLGLGTLFASPLFCFGAALTGYTGFEIWRMADNCQDIYSSCARPEPAWTRTKAINKIAAGTFVAQIALDTFAPDDFGQHLFPHD